MAIEIIPTGAALGAQVKGVDLRRPMSDEVFQEVDAALSTYGVIFFREGFLSEEQHLAIVERFGPPTLVRGGANTNRMKDPHFFDVSNVDDTGELMSKEDTRRLYQLGNQLWHSDATAGPRPARVTALHALVLPEVDSPNTEYADTRLGYERLPQHLKAEIQGLMVHHTVRASRRKVGFTDFSGWETSDTNVALAGAVHPLVRTHAGSGRKALYMGAHAESIVGMPLDEGEALLTKLCEMTTIKDAVYSHEWQLHDLVLWDNGCTMHRALPYDDTQRRELRHCMSLELEPVY